MQTFYRLVIMAMTLLIAVGAVLEYGPPDIVQPVASRVIGLMDELAGTSPSLAVAESTDLMRASFTSELLRRPPEPIKGIEGMQFSSSVKGLGSSGGAALVQFPDVPGREEASRNRSQIRAGNESQLLVGTESADQTTSLTAAWRELGNFGAVDQHLESWGVGGALYRFRCEVPWTESGVATRHFEAIGNRPHEVLAKVLAEIRSWRATEMGRDRVTAAF